MRAEIIRWVKGRVSVEIGNDAINDAIESLWQSLILANVGTYLAQKPARLAEDTDLIPFEELSCGRFIKEWAIHLLLLSVFEFDASQVWEGKAEKSRLQALQEVLQSSRREESIEPYSAYKTS
jgi:hypothetical protein